MKFDVDDKNRCRLVCVKFHLNRCRFAVAVTECLGAHFFGTQCICNISCSCIYRRGSDLQQYVIRLFTNGK